MYFPLGPPASGLAADLISASDLGRGPLPLIIGCWHGTLAHVRRPLEASHRQRARHGMLSGIGEHGKTASGVQASSRSHSGRTRLRTTNTFILSFFFFCCWIPKRRNFHKPPIPLILCFRRTRAFPPDKKEWAQTRACTHFHFTAHLSSSALPPLRLVSFVPVCFFL